MIGGVHIRSSTLIEGFRPGTTDLIAKAYKSSPDAGTWFIGQFLNDRWFVVATLSQPMNERNQRACALAILKEIVES